ncbi:hypothetical protein, partial [Salmonella enterica]|uniref:hypothetical protein n=1 Tax=Salmonella enterica TaxID=28901 RepID=UPI00398C5B88
RSTGGLGGGMAAAHSGLCEEAVTTSPTFGQGTGLWLARGLPTGGGNPSPGGYQSVAGRGDADECCCGRGLAA